MTKTTSSSTSSSTLNQDAAHQEAIHQEAVVQSRLQQLRGVVLSVLSSPARLATYVGTALMGALTGLMNMFKAAPSVVSPTDDEVEALIEEETVLSDGSVLEEAELEAALAVSLELAAEEAAMALALAESMKAKTEAAAASERNDALMASSETVVVDYDSGSEGDNEDELEIEAEVPNNTVARVAAVAGTAVLTGLAAYTVFGAEDGPAGVIRAIPGIVAADAATLAGGIRKGAEVMGQDAKVLLDGTIIPYASVGLNNAGLLLGTLGDVVVGGLSSSLIGLGAIYGATASVMSTAAGHGVGVAVAVSDRVKADAASLTTQLANGFFSDIEMAGSALNDLARNHLELGS